MRQEFEIAVKNKIRQKVSASQNEEAMLVRYFKHFDSDEDGEVNEQEWLRAIEKVGIVVPSLEDLRHLFELYDPDCTGKINYYDFVDILYNNREIKIAQEEVFKGTETVSYEEVLSKIKEKLLVRGVRGLVSFASQLRAAAGPKKRVLDLSQWLKVVRAHRLRISEEEATTFFRYLEIKKTSKLRSSTVIEVLKTPFNKQREQAVMKAFYALDKKKEGTIQMLELKNFFHADRHPDVLKQKRTEEEILLEFLETFEAFHQGLADNTNGDKISYAEFEEYCTYIGATIEDDDEFEKLIGLTWGSIDSKIYDSTYPKKEEEKQTPPYTFLGTQKHSYKKNFSNLPSEENTLHYAAVAENERRLLKKQEIVPEKVQKVLDKIKLQLLKRGMRGMMGFIQRIVTTNPLSDSTTRINLISILKEYRIEVEPSSLLLHLDLKKKGVLNYRLFIKLMLGKISSSLSKVAVQVFEELDKEDTGSVEVSVIKEAYNPSSSKLTEDSVSELFFKINELIKFN